jgi:hypothetical protein
MTQTQSDAERVAAEYVRQLHDGRARLRRARSTTGSKAALLRGATFRAAAGVLRHSEVDADVELARETLLDLELVQTRKRLEADAGALRRHGASIPTAAIDAAAQELAAKRAIATARTLRRRLA